MITTLETDTLTGIENVLGTDFTDTITGNSAANGSMAAMATTFSMVARVPTR